MRIIFRPSFLLSTTFFSIIYLIFSLYLINYRLVGDTVIGQYVISYKLNILVSLIGGLETAVPRLNAFILIVVSLLTGANATILFRNLRARRLPRESCLAAGGSALGSFIGICSACTLPLLTVLGLSGSFILPINGQLEVSVLVIALLSVALYLGLQPAGRKS